MKKKKFHKKLNEFKKQHEEEVEKLKKEYEEETKNLSVKAGLKIVDLISQANLNLRARIGKKFIPLSVVKKLDKSSSIIFEQEANAPLVILIQNQIIAKGEVVIVDGNFGVQITHILEIPIEDKAYYPEKKNKQDPMLLFESILGDIDCTIDTLRKIEKGTVVDFQVPAGSFSKLYVDRRYIGYGEVKVYEKNLGVTFMKPQIDDNFKLPTLSDSDREQFDCINLVKTIDREMYKNTFSSLNELSSDMLFTILCVEHPQTIALTLLNLDEKLAADVLNLFDADYSSEIIMRMSKSKAISDESLFVLSETLKSYYEAKVNKESLDGFTKSIGILNLLSPDKIKNTLDKISKLDESLSDVLKKGVK